MVEASGNDICLSYRYESYFTMACVLRISEEAKEHVNLHSTFAKKVQQYKAKVENYNTASRHSPEAGTSETFRDYLFKTCSHNAFGYGDFVELVLVDDIDPYFFLTNQLDLPVHQVDLGFCPNLHSLGINRPSLSARVSEGQQKASGWTEPDLEIRIKGADGRVLGEARADSFGEFEVKFEQPVDPSETLSAELDSQVFEAGSSQVWEYTAPKFSKELCAEDENVNGEYANSSPFFAIHKLVADEVTEQLPLLVYSRIKIAGLASIGNVNLLRRAIHRAIARRTAKILHEYKGVESKWLAYEDLTSIKIGLLDTQGTEEIGVHLFCRNFSAGLLIMQSVAQLTYGDLFEDPQSKTLEQQIDAWGIHKKICEEQVNPVSSLNACHLFSATYTVLGAVPSSFSDPDNASVEGYLEAYGKVNVRPGHFVDVQEAIIAILGKTKKLEEVVAEPIDLKEPDEGSLAELRFLIGRNDLDFPMIGDQVMTVKTKDFFKLANSLSAYPKKSDEGKFTSTEGTDDDHAANLTTGVVSWSSNLVVPVPVMGEVIKKCDRGHVAVFSELKKKFEKLFKQGGKLDNEGLRQVLASMRLPIRLRNVSYQLLKTFSETLSDSVHYDTVLDLYDQFFALYSFLVGDADECYQFSKALFRPDSDIAGSVFFDAKFTEHLSIYCDGLSNALSHRIHRNTKEEFADLNVVFGGGLTQLVQGAHAALTCSVELIKKMMSTEMFMLDAEVDRSECVGVIKKLSLHQHWKLYRLNPIKLQSESSRNTVLGVVDFSFGHVVNPLEYVDFVHEVGHMILENWDKRQPYFYADFRKAIEEVEAVILETGKVSESAAKQKAKQQTGRFREEYFADLLTAIMVFGNDVELFAKFSFFKFNSYQTQGKTEIDLSTQDTRLIEFLDYSFRIFLVCKTVERCGAAIHSGNFFDPSFPGIPSNLNDYISRPEQFAEFLSEYGYLDCLFKDINRQEQWLQIITSWDGKHKRFSYRATAARGYISDVIERVSLIFQKHCWQSEPWYAQGKDVYIFDRVANAFRESMQKGETSLTAILAKANEDLENEGVRIQLGNDSPDLLGLVCAALNAFTSLQMDDISKEDDKAIHLTRYGDGRAKFEPGKRNAEFFGRTPEKSLFFLQFEIAAKSLSVGNFYLSPSIRSGWSPESPAFKPHLLGGIRGRSILIWLFSDF